MERLISNGGGLRLPVGYRFSPTDEDLVHFYLKKRVLAHPFPVDFIPVFDVFQTEPWGLPPGGQIFREKRYFFSNTKGRVFENINKRAAGSGFWKSDGKSKVVLNPGKNPSKGIKNTLVFWEVKGTVATKTNWVMDEFRLACRGTAPNTSQMAMSDWAVYRIFQNKRKIKNRRKIKKAKGSNGESSERGEGLEDIKPSVIDFTVECPGESGPPPACSP